MESTTLVGAGTHTTRDDVGFLLSAAVPSAVVPGVFERDAMNDGGRPLFVHWVLSCGPY